MRHRIGLVAFGIVAALALAAGCGNGDGGGGGGGAALSHDQYQQLLDDVRAGLEAQEEAFAGFGNITNPQDIVEPMQQAAAASRDVADQLGAVTPPADAAEAHPKLVAGFTKVAELLDQFAEAAGSGDLAKIQEIGQQFSGSPPPEIAALNEGIQELRDAGYSLPQG
jgi:hypothetical protein